jgi:hypothetical protein
VQGGVAAHGEPTDVRLGDPDGVEQSSDVVGRLLLGVDRGIFGHVGGRVPTGVEGDRAVAAAEEAHLRSPALNVAGELVHEDER